MPIALQKTEAKNLVLPRHLYRLPNLRTFPPTNLAPEAANGVGIRFSPSLAPRGVLFSVLDHLEERQERKVRCQDRLVESRKSAKISDVLISATRRAL